MKLSNAFTVGLLGTLGVGLGVLILFSIASLSTILTYVGVALFIALGLDPVITSLERRRLPRWLAILTVLIGVSAVFAGMIFAVVPIIVDQLTQLFSQLPRIFTLITSSEWATSVTNSLGGFIDVNAVITAVSEYLRDPGNLTAIAGGALQVGIAVANGVFGAIIVLILTLYFTANLGLMKRSLYQLAPASKRERFAELAEQVTESVGRYVVGQVSLAVINGLLSFIVLSIIQAPFPAVLAFVAGLLSLIPLVGTLSGSVLIVLVCLIPGLGSPLTALVAGIYYIVYMQVEAYLLSPKIMNRAVSVPGAIVVIAALAGGTLLGVLGALIAIPVAATFLLVIKQVIVPWQNAR